MFLGRVVEPDEPEWLPTDRDKALWWLIHDRQTCPGCGTRAEEWEADQHAYIPEPVHCRGCEVTAQGADHMDKHRKEYRRGTSMQLRRRQEV